MNTTFSEQTSRQGKSLERVKINLDLKTINKNHLPTIYIGTWSLNRTYSISKNIKKIEEQVPLIFKRIFQGINYTTLSTWRRSICNQMSPFDRSIICLL